jgi:hypothetical protein
MGSRTQRLFLSVFIVHCRANDSKRMTSAMAVVSVLPRQARTSTGSIGDVARMGEGGDYAPKPAAVRECSLQMLFEECKGIGLHIACEAMLSVVETSCELPIRADLVVDCGDLLDRVLHAREWVQPVVDALLNQ